MGTDGKEGRLALLEKCMKGEWLRKGRGDNALKVLTALNMAGNEISFYGEALIQESAFV